MSAAIVVPAPGRLSTRNCCPIALVRCAAITRESTSEIPPGGKGTMTRTGFVG
jgi:hypothetical protein